MSQHTWRSRNKLQRNGAFAGAIDFDDWDTLANMSKGTLIETGIRLACRLSGHPDNPEAGLDVFMEEFRALKQAGMFK